MADLLGKNIPKLGFGLMRLPKKALLTDHKQTAQMVDRFLISGFTYFDTAFVYPGSEPAAKKALVDRHPRDTYTLASKLNVMVAATEKMAKNQLFTSLERTGAEYLDFYLLHALMENNYKKYERFHLWEFVQEQKEKGLIKHIGFSFHGSPELLEKLLTEHPEVEFVQLQINYNDWESKSIASRANYEIARRHGKPIVVMEPVKGGRLANPPAEVKKLLKEANPEASCASWAIRFAASLDGIMTVLSGMSDLDQMNDNLSYMKNFRPLDDSEQKVIQQAQKILGNFSTIPCTDCHYCTEGCPQNIPIPEIFSAMNKRIGNGLIEEAKADYEKAVDQKGKASVCIGCRRCEQSCPQHLAITEYLKQCALTLE